MTEDWASELRHGRPDTAWDLFLTRYRRLMFAAIRHYARDYDDVMEVFTHACEHLHADDMRRLRGYLEKPDHSARFTTWLVTVVHNVTVDWFRQRDGRRRLPAVADQLPALRRRIFELVFLQSRSHLETFELLRTSDAPDLTFRAFLGELRATYATAMNGRRGRILPALGGPEPPEPDEDGSVDVEDLKHLAARILDSLSPEDRVAVELYVVEELPAERVAGMLGLPNAKAVYNRVYRALAAVRERLERAGLTRGDLL